MSLLRLSALTRRWRITLDPSHEDAPREERHDFEQIMGKHGVIYAHDANRLAVNCEYTRAQTKLADNPWLSQLAANVWLFHSQHLDDVCGAIKARKKRARSLTPEQRHALNERLRRGRDSRAQNKARDSVRAPTPTDAVEAQPCSTNGHFNKERECSR